MLGDMLDNGGKGALVAGLIISVVFVCVWFLSVLDHIKRE